VIGDLRDLPLLQTLLGEGGTDTCFHLGAQALVGLANASPLPTLEANITGTWNILEACRLSPSVEGVVVASSDKAYGDQPVLPYTEDLPLRGTYPYDASKACADLLTRSYAVTYGLPVAITRMANIFGGGDFNLSRIVPGTIVSVLRGEDPVIRSDGTPIRDYMYVEDAVSAYLALGARLPDKAVAGEAFNFGTNDPIDVLTLTNRIIAAIGDDTVRPKIMSPTKIHGEIDRQFLDSSKAERELSWQAETSLDDGLLCTIEWYRANAAQLTE
jgi:CDP-glucose 4,6-dehydratase